MSEANKKFEAKLVNEFPNLFVDMYGDMRETCMHWGICTGPGWFDLIYQLAAKLEEMILKLPANQRQHVKAAQVKEKFGSLCFYMSVYPDGFRSVIAEAENKSLTICEKCGQPGQLCGEWQKNEWLYTSCKEHAKPQHKDNFK